MATEKQISYLRHLLQINKIDTNLVNHFLIHSAPSSANFKTVDEWLNSLSVATASSLIENLIQKARAAKNNDINRMQAALNTINKDNIRKNVADIATTTTVDDNLLCSAADEITQVVVDPIKDDTFQQAVNRLACSSIPPQETVKATGKKILFDKNGDVRADEYLLHNGTVIWKKTISGVADWVEYWYIPQSIAKALSVIAAKKAGITAEKAKEWLRTNSKVHGEDIYIAAVEADL